MIRLIALALFLNGCALHVNVPENVPHDTIVIVLCLMSTCEIPERKLTRPPPDDEVAHDPE